MTKSTPNFPPMRFDNKEISKKNPWYDDVLERNKFADVLTGRIKNGVSPYTISVSGGWGTGKTFMLQRWRQQLENDGYKAIYYNAWEDDFCVNPLVSIIGQIATEIEGRGFKKLINHIKKIAAPLLVKKFLDHVNLTKKELQSEIKNALNKYSEQTAQIKALKESLETLTTKIEGETGHPLIFIIDELDRCRPTFAIEVLERIKHLFNIPGIIFVLGMNRIELEKSIKHVYGDINSEEYLRRFYDIDLTLSASNSSYYYHHLINTNKNSLNILKFSTTDYSYLFDYLNLSLRDTEHCFRVLCFMLSTENFYNKKEIWATSCLIVILLRIKNSELYWRFIQGQSSCAEVTNYICESFTNTSNNIKLIDDIVIGIYALANNVDWANTMEESDLYKNESISRSQLKFETLAKIALPRIIKEGSSYFREPHGGNALKEIASLLDLVER